MKYIWNSIDFIHILFQYFSNLNHKFINFFYLQTKNKQKWKTIKIFLNLHYFRQQMVRTSFHVGDFIKLYYAGNVSAMCRRRM